MFKKITFALLVLASIISSALVHAQHSAVRFTTPRFAFDERDYPDPRTIVVPAPVITGRPANPLETDRYAKISEQERMQRICEDQCCGIDGKPLAPCPLCEDDPKTPCGRCKMCLAGFPCERTLCRHCVQMRSQNMCNSCDLSAGDEPCGTCDACREHRSDPCEHADDGHGIRGEFNPYKEPRFLSVIPRPILDTYNNGARKFPVYYNPAPYYRPHWNPSLYAGYARPFSFRWSCPLCFKDPCGCDKPGMAGQVPYAYACKFCNRNPCACAQDICNVNKEMEPKGRSLSLADERKTSTRVQDTHSKKEADPAKKLTDAGESTDKLLDDDELPSLKKSSDDSRTIPEDSRQPRSIPTLDAPANNTPARVQGSTGTVN